MAAILIETANDKDWSALAAMLMILMGTSTVIGVLISGLVVKPMIDKAVERLTTLISLMVTKEAFAQYETQDRREHDAMQNQLDAVFNRLNK